MIAKQEPRFLIQKVKNQFYVSLPSKDGTPAIGPFLALVSIAVIIELVANCSLIVQGMVDPGEKVSQTLKREFLEEALNGHLLDEKSKNEKSKILDKFFDSGSEIFRGQVVTDPRNTDNSWMETVVYHVHDEDGAIVGKLDLKAGDDAKDVEWRDIDSNLNLYADHKKFIQMIVDRMNAHW